MPNATKPGSKPLHDRVPSYEKESCNLAQHKSRAPRTALQNFIVRRMIHAEDKNRETLSHLIEYLNNPKAAEYRPDQIWSDNFIEKRHWPFQKGTGREAFVRLLDEIHEAFSDYCLEMPLIISEGDDAAVRMVMTGTHTAPFQGISPTGRKVHWEVLAHMKFKNGLIEEQETFRDWMELMSQLQWPSSTS